MEGEMQRKYGIHDWSKSEIVGEEGEEEDQSFFMGYHKMSSCSMEAGFTAVNDKGLERTLSIFDEESEKDEDDDEESEENEGEEDEAHKVSQKDDDDENGEAMSVDAPNKSSPSEEAQPLRTVTQEVDESLEDEQETCC